MDQRGSAGDGEHVFSLSHLTRSLNVLLNTLSGGKCESLCSIFRCILEAHICPLVLADEILAEK